MPDRAGALHAVRVSGWLTPDRLTAWGVDQPDQVLSGLVDDGLLRRVRTARGEMYALTALGTEHAAAWSVAWLAGLSDAVRARLTDLLASFEQFDPQLKRLITDWQGGARESAGAALASAAVAELHRAARGTLNAIAAAGSHWASYPGRLDRAVDQLADGDARYVASPLVESYHTVWHLLHSDLRLVIGEK